MKNISRSRKAAAIILMLYLFLHAPAHSQDPAAAENLQEIGSREILAKIENGEPISYSNIIIRGNMDLGDLGLSSPRLVKSPIFIADSEITGNVNFDGAVLTKSVRFEKTRFDGTVSFNDSVFQKDASFVESLFGQMASFEDAQFQSGIDLERTRFESCAIFLHAIFSAGVQSFRDCRFQEAACFNYAAFNSQRSVFSGANFNGPASFWHAKFDGDADFTGAYFSQPADFNFVQFNSSSSFLGSRFASDLFLNSAKFKNLKISWDSIGMRLVTDGPTYISLIKNFRELEQFEDADDCYYHYRDWKRSNRPLGWAKFFDYLAWLSCGYGIRWYHTILTGLFMILLFGIYYGSYESLRGLPANPGGKDDVSSLNSPVREFHRVSRRALSFSAIVLLSLPPEWCPSGREDYTRRVRLHLFSATVERMIGWGLMLLLIGTISRLMVRY